MKPPAEKNSVHAWLSRLVPELAKRVTPHTVGDNFSPRAIRTVAELLRERSTDANLNPKTDVSVEGHRAPWDERTRKFLKSPCYPDLGLRIREDWYVAIEVDHGHVGSHVRNALTKASFNVAVGNWQECYVFFFDETGGELEKAAKEEGAKSILGVFQERFNTRLVFIPFRKG